MDSQNQTTESTSTCQTYASIYNAASRTEHDNMFMDFYNFLVLCILHAYLHASKYCSNPAYFLVLSEN
jgi:hypothetical protein